MAPLSRLRRCLASLLVAQCSLGTDPPASPPRATASARAAWARRAAAAAFIAAPPGRPGDGGVGLEHLMRVLRLDDAIFVLHKPLQHQHKQRRDPAAVAAAAGTTTTVYSDVGRPPLTCWSKDQWAPRRETSSWSSPRHPYRQRSTRLTWAKCQWSPTSYQPPSWRGSSSSSSSSRSSYKTAGERLRWEGGGGGARGGVGAEGRRGASSWSKVQWSPREDDGAGFGDSRGTSTRLRGRGGVGGGAGAGTGVAAAGAGGGGGAFNSVSLPPPPAARTTSVASFAGRTGSQPGGASSTARPALAGAALESTGPKDISGAPVEVIDSAERYFQVLKENAEENKIVVIKIYAGFCRACKAFDRKFRLLSLDFQEQGADNVKFFEMDWMKTRDLCKSLQVKKLPHMELYVGQRGRLESFVCGPSKSGVLKEKLDRLVADPNDPSLGEAPIPDEDSFAYPPPADSKAVDNPEKAAEEDENSL